MLGSNPRSGVEPVVFAGTERDPALGFGFGPTANSWKGQMLTDIKCRTEKAAGSKEKKISDGFGLYLLVKPSGTKLWQMAYRFNGRQKKLSFGIYGSDDEGRVSLATARKKRDEARAAVQNGYPTLKW